MTLSNKVPRHLKKMSEKVFFQFVRFWDQCFEGFHILAEGLDQYSIPDSSRLVLQRMFSASTEEKGDYVKSLSEEYHKYKRQYVNHLCFNPDKDDLSKCSLI